MAGMPVPGIPGPFNSDLVGTRGSPKMGQIIQTLALAMVLLIVGLSCVVIGVAGLALLARRDRRRIDKAEKTVRSTEITEGTRTALPLGPTLPTPRRSTYRAGRKNRAPARIQLGQPLLLLLDSGAELALVFQQTGNGHRRPEQDNHSTLDNSPHAPDSLTASAQRR